LWRRRNENVLNTSNFTASVSAIQAEMIQSAEIQYLPVSDFSIFANIAEIGRHNLNATDAAILRTLLDYKRDSGDDCILISCDRRLLRAAELEGIKTLNPEMLGVVAMESELAKL
jgi:predicted nucleic acid-binding protein